MTKLTGVDEDIAKVPVTVGRCIYFAKKMMKGELRGWNHSRPLVENEDNIRILPVIKQRTQLVTMMKWRELTLEDIDLIYADIDARGMSDPVWKWMYYLKAEQAAQEKIKFLNDLVEAHINGVWEAPQICELPTTTRSSGKRS